LTSGAPLGFHAGMTTRGRTVASRILVGVLLALACASASFAAPCECKQLPALEQELFEQEWLQREFYEYALGNKTPPRPTGDQTGAEALAGQVLASFRAWLHSPAGSGGSRGGAPELGTSWGKCELVAYRDAGRGRKPRYQEIPFDEKKFRNKNCDELANYLITHEQKHVDQCKKYGDSTRVDINGWMDYAAFDAEAYGAGIKNLRKSIAELAKKCGWHGSTNPTKKNPVTGEDVDVVPTMEEAKAIANALGAGAK
jgi:hypothetical protein